MRLTSPSLTRTFVGANCPRFGGVFFIYSTFLP